MCKPPRSTVFWHIGEAEVAFANLALTLRGHAGMYFCFLEMDCAELKKQNQPPLATSMISIFKNGETHAQLYII